MNKNKKSMDNHLVQMIKHDDETVECKLSKKAKIILNTTNKLKLTHSNRSVAAMIKHQSSIWKPIVFDVKGTHAFLEIHFTICLCL